MRLETHLAILFLAGAAVLAAWIRHRRDGLPFWPNRGLPYPSWHWSMALFAPILTMVVSFPVGAIYMQATPGVNPEELTPGDIVELSFWCQLAILAILPITLKRWGRGDWGELGLALEHPGDDLRQAFKMFVLVTPLTTAVFLVAVQVFGLNAHPLEEALRDWSPGRIVIGILAGVVLAPLTEELVYRGVLLPMFHRFLMARIETGLLERLGTAGDEARGLDGEGEGNDRGDAGDGGRFVPAVREEEAERFAFWHANITSSIIFAGLHLPQWPAPIPIMILSLALGYLYRRTGSLLAPIALHAMFNGNSMIIAALAGP